MNRRNPAEKREMDWTDGISDEENEEPCERTYRDGSIQNECWNPAEWSDGSLTDQLHKNKMNGYAAREKTITRHGC